MNMNLNKINEILKKLVNIEERLNKIDKFDCINARIDSLESKFEEKINAIDNVLMTSKKMQCTNSWHPRRWRKRLEKRETTIEKYQDFLEKGLKISNPDGVEFVDIHRLPQHPVKKNGKHIHRPIIVKLLTMSDKNLIFKNAKYVKEYNNERKQGQEFCPYIYVSEHLPKKFQQENSYLMNTKKKQESIGKKLYGRW